ncbi:hypothetical protein CDV31_008564 [Fusarium ambrosium]|uniref:PD-(D/E)XK nuclease-like domain-containing protein n=1 Tax=Fusarium ambrosium TaxID=131363 RepID=A0A428U068_9HYPO|nr:hypothetical protein CDV31_008564 [Fusarium ambrosium]
MVKPEPGNSPTSLAAPPKKRKFDDANRTPRASDVMMGYMAGSVPDSPLNLRGRNTPQRVPSASGQTSYLPLDDMALEVRQMQVDKTSFSLVREMQEIDMGHGLLPSESRDQMMKHLLENNQHFHIWRSAFLEGPDTLPGNFPSWARLANFREKARDCFDQGQDESAWTMEVYYRLLSRTFRAPQGSEKGNLDFTPW